MDNKPENPPAFPGNDGVHANNPDFQTGMTLRDYFATHSSITFNEARQACEDANPGFRSYRDIYEYWSQMNYSYADAMLKARQS